MCVLDHVPYVHRRNGEEGFTLDTKGFIQSLITAILSGLLVMYGTQRSIMTEINTIRSDIEDVKHSVNEIRRDFYFLGT